MGYFPFFADIKGTHWVIAGGGKVALRKIEKLLPFEPDITVIAPKICGEIRAIDGVKMIFRELCDGDIDGAFAVISATDDKDVSRHIYALCKEKNIPVNTVDDINNCSFIFPALAVRGDVTVGITTSGKSPVCARFLREKAEEMLDDRFYFAMETVSRFRPLIKEMFCEEQQRKYAMEKLFGISLESEKGLSDDEAKAVLKELIREDENQTGNEKKQACSCTDAACN
jgi:siroheme synthase-like protein